MPIFLRVVPNLIQTEQTHSHIFLKYIEHAYQIPDIGIYHMYMFTKCVLCEIRMFKYVPFACQLYFPAPFFA